MRITSCNCSSPKLISAIWKKGKFSNCLDINLNKTFRKLWIESKMTKICNNRIIFMMWVVTKLGITCITFSMQEAWLRVFRISTAPSAICVSAMPSIINGLMPYLGPTWRRKLKENLANYHNCTNLKLINSQLTKNIIHSFNIMKIFLKF